MTKLIIITRLIWSLDVTSSAKTKLSSCVFYNVKRSDNVDLVKRYRKCKERMLK